MYENGNLRGRTVEIQNLRGKIIVVKGRKMLYNTTGYKLVKF